MDQLLIRYDEPNRNGDIFTKQTKITYTEGFLGTERYLPTLEAIMVGLGIPSGVYYESYSSGKPNNYRL